MISNHMFKIRPALESELSDAVALEVSCGLSTGGVERFRRLLADASNLLIGAFTEREDPDRQKMIGFISGTVVLDEFQIDNLVVKEGFRGKGLGVELVRLGLRESAKLGAVTAVLEVRISNAPALKVYEKCGFEVVGKRLAYYPDPEEDALTLRCRFASFFSPGAENSS